MAHISVHHCSVKHVSYSYCSKCDSTHSPWTDSTPSSCLQKDPVHMCHFSAPQMESWETFSPHLAQVTVLWCPEQLSCFSTCRLVHQNSAKHGSYSCCPKCDRKHSPWTHSTPCSCNWKESVYSFHFFCSTNCFCSSSDMCWCFSGSFGVSVVVFFDCP